MTLEHFYSDINGVSIKEARLGTPTDSEIQTAIKTGKFKGERYNIFSDGTILEVKTTIQNGVNGNLYRDMYRIKN